MANKLRRMKLADAVKYLQDLGYKCFDRGFGRFEASHKSMRNLWVTYDRASYVVDVTANW